jgi:uncharacterized Tic20 family protein
MTVALPPTRAAAATHWAAAAAVVAAIVAGLPLLAGGLLAFLGPLGARLTIGRTRPFVRRHAAEALSFNVSVALYLGASVALLRVTAGSPYTVQLVPFALFLDLLLAFNWLVFIAIGAHRAATGQTFSYPLTLRWIRALLLG